jgi:hypothetical protein
MEKKDAKEMNAIMTKLLTVAMKMAGKDCYATQALQDKLIEDHGLIPDDKARSAYNDLLITLETTPREYRNGLIRALILRFCTHTELLSLYDYARDLFADYEEAKTSNPDMFSFLPEAEPEDLRSFLD